MSSEIYNEIGLTPPMPIGGSKAEGATILMLDGHSGDSFLRGEIVRCVPVGHDTDIMPPNVQFSSIAEPVPPAVGNNGVTIAGYTYGVCLEAIPAGGRGRVMVRGTCLVLCEKVTGNFSLDACLITGLGVSAQNGTLAWFRDAAVNVVVKVVGKFRGGDTYDSTTPALRPVLFNGAEGHMVTLAYA